MSTNMYDLAISSRAVVSKNLADEKCPFSTRSFTSERRRAALRLLPEIPSAMRLNDSSDWQSEKRFLKRLSVFMLVYGYHNTSSMITNISPADISTVFQNARLMACQACCLSLPDTGTLSKA